MIAAGLVLLALGLADLARQAVHRHRWVALAAVLIVVLALGVVVDAVPAAAMALAVTTGWVWLMPVGAPARAGVWPAVAVFGLATASVAWIAPRSEPGLIGPVWRMPVPGGELTPDHAVLVIGAAVFLLESANVVVRAALGTHALPARTGGARAPRSAEPRHPPPATDGFVIPPRPPLPGAPARDEPPEPEGGSADDAVPLPERPSLKGGRLIGPLERILVFALTLAGAYALLAAALAAKGIVRFPEISRDDAGDRAEYFLVGSLVSWVLALASAFLVWWGFGLAR